MTVMYRSTRLEGEVEGASLEAYQKTNVSVEKGTMRTGERTCRAERPRPKQKGQLVVVTRSYRRGDSVS